jgi:hypothetical protein
MITKFALLVLTIFVGYNFAQPIQSRYNYGALLEPIGKIINGAGQDPIAFNNYWNVMHTQNKPAIFMTYVGLKNIQSNWTDVLKTELLSYDDKFIIPQIGLSMTEDGNPSAHFEQDVAAGLYDEEINAFIDGLRSLAIPAYVRIGYEFNGLSWNGYQPASYKSAFTRITNMIRASGLEVATVWCFAMDGVMNYMDYYPGDAVVDWWAIDLFSVNHFTDPNSSRFLDSAGVHQKPVMIGETTPRYVGVLNGQQSWNDWFVPLFNFIHTKPAIKAFCYINWDWSQYPQWQNWGDARLEENTIVGGNFASEMDSTKYLHSSSESIFRKILGSADITAPQTPQNISLLNLDYPVVLSWDPASDPSGLSHYIIYKNGVLSDYTLNIPYSDYNISAGDSIEYRISVMDRAGNESLISPPINIVLPNKIEKARNGEFDFGNTNWALDIFDQQANATFEIDSTFILTGKYSAKVNVTQSSGTNWHIQLAQSLNIFSNHKYKFQFKATSSGSKILGYMLQKATSPYTIYLSGDVTLTNSMQLIADSVEINSDDEVKFRFLLGSLELESVWIDEVSISETNIDITDVKEDNNILPSEFNLSQNYPNPFNPNTKISWQSPVASHQTIKVYDVLGNVIATLVDEYKPAGNYDVDFDASKLSSGVYLYKLTAGNFFEAKKMILLR